ncbi:MAG TPA: hypothetical protein PLD55_09285 [bacterium]|nr:hypothetical protein [bacterium]
MKKIFLILSVVALIFISCNSKKKTVPTDGEITDNDSVSADDDDSGTLPDSVENDETGEIDDQTVEPDSEVDQDIVDEDPYPYLECDIETKNCGETEICLFVWEKGKYYCLPSCDPEATEPCEGEKVCEPVFEETNYGCFPRLRVSGKVFNLESEMYEPVEGATVVGMFTSGISTDTILTDSLGNYEFFVRMLRNNMGLPVTKEALTLSVSAMGFEQVPGILRPSLPITFENVSCSDSMCNIHSGFLSIGLYPLDDSVLRYKINGKISEKKGGVLIIAEFDFSPCPLAYTDENGEFSIFNVPAGDYSLRAYVKDKNYSTETVTVVDKDIDGVELDLLETPLSTLSGSVNIVNAPGGSKTSIVLIPASTFIESFSKGILAPGLRAPDYGIEPNVSGNYTITGIPDGKYYVLAAFENDLLVRDPDPNIAGTQILKVTFPADGPVYDISIGNFKVTEAIPIIFPGAEGPELISEPPLFQWERDASATKYIVNVYTAQGTVQWTKEVPKTDDAVMSVQYDGPALKGFYQWIVVSYKNTAPISMSEDLLGIFYTNMQY